MYPRIIRTALLAAITVLLSGCFLSFGGGKSRDSREEYQANYTPRNVNTRGTIPKSVRRVVVLPIYWEQDPGADFVADLDNILLMSLQRTNAFELVPVGRAQMDKLFGHRQFSSVQVLPDNMIPTLTDMFAADAVLFIDLTVNRPYKPMALGFRARIVDLRNMTVIWAIDSLFDSSDPAVAHSAMEFAVNTTYNPHPVDNSGSILQSPRAFAAFVADTMFNTLPTR